MCNAYVEPGESNESPAYRTQAARQHYLYHLRGERAKQRAQISMVREIRRRRCPLADWRPRSSTTAGGLGCLVALLEARLYHEDFYVAAGRHSAVSC